MITRVMYLYDSILNVAGYIVYLVMVDTGVMYLCDTTLNVAG